MFGYHSKIRAVEAIWHGGDTSFCIHTSDLSTLILIRIQHRFALAIGDLPSHQKKKRDLHSYLFFLKNIGSRYRFSLFLHFLCGTGKDKMMQFN